MNFNGAAFPKNFGTDNVRQQRTGQDCECSLSKQLEARFAFNLFRNRAACQCSEGRPNKSNESKDKSNEDKWTVDRDKDGQPVELQETNNVIFHPAAVSSSFTLSE